MVRTDLPEVIAIASQNSDPHWTEQELKTKVGMRNTIAIVAERNDMVVGMAVYELHPQRLHIINLVVSEKYRNQGIGRAIVEKLISKLSEEKRNRITLLLSECNLTAQQFFRAMGFRAVQIIRNPNMNSGEDSYCMRYAVHEESNTTLTERK